MINLEQAKIIAQEIGFTISGATTLEPNTLGEEQYREWLQSGRGDDLPYMHKYMDVRFDARNLLEGAQSALVCGLLYKNRYSKGYPPTHNAKIASYALLPDYHKVVRKRLKALLRGLQLLHPSLQGRCCVDTAPLLEKGLAIKAGLGWRGRNSLLINPQYGSFMVLGVLLLDGEFDRYNTPLEGGGCGACHRCVDSCPTHALGDKKTVDSRRCISCQSVECDQARADIDLHGWIFGCDECQVHCPYNLRVTATEDEVMQPLFEPPTAEQWLKMSSEQFASLTARTPISRSNLERICRLLKD